MMMQNTNCVVKAHKVQTVKLTLYIQVQIVTTCAIRNKIRLQTFLISHFWLLRSSKF